MPPGPRSAAAARGPGPAGRRAGRARRERPRRGGRRAGRAGGGGPGGANLCGADLRGADLCDADLRGANLAGAKVGGGGDEATLVGSRPVVQIGPIGSRNDWFLVFWCGDAGVRISAGCQKQISEAHFLKRLAYRHGEGDQANIHAQHYIEALAFAKRLLKDQAEGKL